MSCNLSDVNRYSRLRLLMSRLKESGRFCLNGIEGTIIKARKTLKRQEVVASDAEDNMVAIIIIEDFQRSITA